MTKDDEFLEKAKITNIKPLHQGTGYSAGKILEEFPDLDPKKAWELVNQKFHEGVFPESKAIEQVIEELRKKMIKEEKMNEKPSKILRGSASQFFVAGELCRRNLIATITLGNCPNTDILVSNLESDKLAHIQVKTFVPPNISSI